MRARTTTILPARGMQKNVRELWTALHRKRGVNAPGLQSLERRVCRGRDTRARARTQDERRVPQPPPPQATRDVIHVFAPTSA